MMLAHRHSILAPTKRYAADLIPLPSSIASTIGHHWSMSRRGSLSGNTTVNGVQDLVGSGHLNNTNGPALSRTVNGVTVPDNGIFGGATGYNYAVPFTCWAVFEADSTSGTQNIVGHSRATIRIGGGKFRLDATWSADIADAQTGVHLLIGFFGPDAIQHSWGQLDAYPKTGEINPYAAGSANVTALALGWNSLISDEAFDGVVLESGFHPNTELDATARADLVAYCGAKWGSPTTVPITAPAFVDATTATRTTFISSFPINYPSGIQAGDLLVLSISGSTNQTYTVTGFSRLVNYNAHGAVQFRMADGTEGSSVSIGVSSTAGQNTAVMAAYRGVEPTYMQGYATPPCEFIVATNNTATVNAPGVTALGVPSRAVSTFARASLTDAVLTTDPVEVSTSSSAGMTQRASLNSGQAAVGLYDKEITSTGFGTLASTVGNYSVSVGELGATLHLPPTGVKPFPFLWDLSTLGSTQSIGTPVSLSRSGEADDIEFLMVWFNGSSTPTIGGHGTPDFTLIDSVQSSNMSWYLYWRRLTSSSTQPAVGWLGGSSLGTSNGLFARSWIFRNCITTGTPFESGASRKATASTSIQSPTSAITSSGPNRLFVALVAVDDDNSVTGLPSGFILDPSSASTSTTGGDAASWSSTAAVLNTGSSLPANTSLYQQSSDYYSIWCGLLIPPS